jgi:nucleoid-associated protein YgaU
VARLEAQLATLKPPKAAQKTYTVRPGDTLSGIAGRLGLADWRPLYEANRKLIGADPDLIRPGQVLKVP